MIDDIERLPHAELVALARLGDRFRRQQSGRKPGPLATLIDETLRSIGEPFTFSRLIVDFEFQALRYQHGLSSPVLEVDTEFAKVVFLLAGREVERSFAAIRWHLTQSKRRFRTIR